MKKKILVFSFMVFLMLLITPFTSAISISDVQHDNNPPIKPFTFDDLIRILLALFVINFPFVSVFLMWLIELWVGTPPF